MEPQLPLWATCCTTFVVKDFFLISSLNLPSFSLKPLLLVLSQKALLKKPLPVFLTSPLQVLKGCNKVSLEPSVLQAEQPQIPQPVLIGKVFQPSDFFCGPPLDPLQQLHVPPVLGASEMDAGLQVSSH